MKAWRSRWRRELLLVSILGMDATWLTPWTAILAGTTQGPPHGLSLPRLFGLLVVALLGTRLLGTLRLPLGAQQALAGLLAIGTGLVLIGVHLYSEYPLLGQGWIVAWLGDLAALQSGGMSGLVLLGVGLYAWGRGISLAQNRLETAAVGFYLRWGIIAWFWLHLYGLIARADAPLGWLFLFFFFGLLAVGLSRVEEVHRGRGAVRSPFNASWLAIMASSALGAVGLGFAATLVLSRGLVVRVWSALSPLGAALRWLLYRFVELAFLLLMPLLEWLTRALAPAAEDLMSRRTPVVVATPAPVPQPAGVPLPVRALIWAALGLGFLFIVALVVTVLRRGEEQAEPWLARGAAWEATGGTTGNGLGARLQRLRDRLAGALRAMRPLSYALASVREMYASLLRLAAWRGIPRDEAETPYELERRLDGTWPQAEEAVGSITEAYVRAHYGERSFSAAEVEVLRAHWERLQQLMEGTEEE